MKKFLLILFLFFYSIVLVKGQALTPVAGDYRTAASGNWSSTSSWQVRDGAGGWTTPSVLPTSTSNVFIQRGHTITVDITTAACYNLHLDVNGILAIGNNFVSISNKIRAFAATASTASATDGTFYTDTLPPTSLALNATMVTSSLTGGLKFIGGSRYINLATEWNSNGTSNVSVVFALDAGVTGNLGAGFKAKSFTIQSGFITTNQFVSAGAVGTGRSFVVKNGAKFTSSRSSATPVSPSIANVSSSSTKCDTVVLETGGIMEFTGANPTIDCSFFSNNGTVVYSASAVQTLLQPSTNGGVVANNLLSYKNLTISGTSLKTIPSGYVINVSDTFTLAGNNSCLLASAGGSYLTYSPGGTLVSSGTNTTYTLAATSLEWPVTNGPTNVAVTQNKLAFTLSAGMSRKITGTLSLLNTVASPGGFNINTGNTLVMANGSTIFRNDVNATLTTTAGLVIGEAAGDKVNVTIGSTMACGNELLTTPPVPSLGTYGTLKILAGTYSIPSANRTITDLNNNGILALSPSTATFTINGNLSGAGTITGNSFASLTIGGTNTGSAGVINMTSASQVLNAFTMNRPSGSVSFGSNVTITTLNLTAGTVSDGGNIITLTGSITGTATHESIGSGKLLMTGSGAAITAATLGRLEINPGAGVQITANSLTVINKDLILTSGLFNAGASANYVTVNGDLLGTSGSQTGNGRIKMTGANNFVAGINLNNLEIASPGSITATGNVNINSTLSAGGLTLTSGTFKDAGYTITILGNIFGTATHESSGSGKILMTGISTTISAATLGRLEINPGANNQISAVSLTTINKDLILTSGFIYAGVLGNYITVNGDLLGTSGSQTGNGRIKMAGANNIIAGINVNNLEIATSGTITATGNFNINSTLSTGGLTLTSGTFNDGGKIITIVGGNLFGTSGVHVSQTGGKIVMTSTNTRYISATSIGNLEIANSSTIAASNNFTIKNTLTLTSGILNDAGYIITVNGDLLGTSGRHTSTVAGIPANGEIKMTGTAGPGVNNYVSNVIVDSLEIASTANLIASGSFTINRGLYLQGSINDGGYFIFIAGNIFGPGTHTGTGRIKMTGTAKSINGRPTLNNVEISTGASTSAGFGAIIAGTLYMNGGNITVDSLNGQPNTLTFKNNSSIIRTSGNLNINGGIVQMGTASTDVITVFINGNFTAANGSGSSNELPSNHIGNIDLTINDGFSYSIRSNSKFVRNLNVSNGHMLCGFDTLTQTGYNLAVTNLATISGDFYLDSTAYDFTGNTSVPTVLSAAGPFKVGPSLIINATGKLQFGNVNNKTLYSNGLLLLKSRNNGTASVGDVTNGGVNSGNRILGATTVERFISNIRNLSSNADPTVKAWRLIAMPTKHDYQTIKQSWQEGASLNSNPNPGYGTQIVSNGTSWMANGFDTVANGPSVKYYDPVANNYVGISSTNLAMEKGKAYMVFVRGSRARTQYTQSPDTTVLRERGTLNVGDTTYTVGTAGNQFVSLPNPFPSAIDYRQSLATATNISPFIYLYDPRMGNYGAFVTADINGNTTASTTYASGPAFLQSCQGFFVKTTSAAGSFNFKETSKVDGSAMTFRSNVARSALKVNLLKNQNGIYELTDGMMHIFDDASNNNVDNNDAVKFNNLYENISIKNSDKNLAIENRRPIQISDTFYYQIGLRTAAYQIQFLPENIQSSGSQAYLEDLYLNTSTPVSLSDTTSVDFEVNSDAGSYAPDRFRLVFRPMVVLPLSYTSVEAVVKEKNVLVSWKVNSEVNISQYVVERSSDAISYMAIGVKNAIGNAAVASYDLTDLTPLQDISFYRIKGIGANGEIKYSQTVTVTIRKTAAGFSVSPNPIGNDHKLTLKNEGLAAGKYEVNLFDFTGRRAFAAIWNKQNKNSTFNIQLPKTFSPGEYRLCVDNNEIKVCESILIE